MNIIRNLVSDPKLPDILKCVILRAIRAWFLSDLLARICFTQVFLIKGKEKVANCNLTTLLFGNEEFVHYFSRLVYSEDTVIQTLGETTYSNVPSRNADTKADVVLVKADTAFSGFLSRKGFSILPVINQALDISGSWDAFYARLSRGRRRDIRAIEKLGYTYEITKDPEKFSFFYYKMYLPHILKRHGKSAEPVIFDELEKCFRIGGLLFVKLDGKYVSGLLYTIYTNKLKNICRVQNICSGIYEARGEYYAKGAVQAARYFLIHWSKQQGYEEIDQALSNPFMKDGVFTYKRGWGAKVRRNDDIIHQSIYALRLCNFGNEVREFLAHNPFIFTHSKSLRGLVFLNSESPTEEKLKNLYHLYYTPDLSDLVVISYLTNKASGMVFKVTPESHVIEKYSLRKGVPHSLDFLTKLAPKMCFNIYLIDAHAFLQPKRLEASPNR